ncbi:MAG TPA: multifunctional oxoglutarate decarboxylase/oxoglutarate dehydrogenase thiamine pyrophosphate-binding subunit/dihydrolipoyllysine-residue succinyltransferase subunit [Acidimicrobiales bacterium]|jgi:2-oxoglutarate decarboxylase|nr:multifunctional oxoglutarate decarboxylase/oxoglutarate dehydrogenase thiamine pyrophosphate-binding subunit/dihydrolipoyllysine-residue succinyltransferase subunit [Acidimicrobiales bacterium]
MAQERQASFGPNAWLVDEMYDRYRADPASVSESWQDFFADYRVAPQVAEPTETPAAPPTAPAAPGPRPPAGPASHPAVAPDDARPLRGAAARLVANMEASLAVPTATSARVIPARLLEVNRKVLNGYLARTGGGKVSFTHLIGYAVVKALAAVPAMRSVFVDLDGGGGGAVARPAHVGLGLAIDVPKADGSRTLLVPCIPDADTLDFAAFQAAYEDLVRRVRNNRIAPDDFAGVTMTLTNPGTLGTVSSVPRLMPGQSVIVGVGALGWPAEYAGADPQVMAQLGISKVLTLTSTYDHRVIQGAESGLYLQRVEQLLLGADGFYDEVFRSVGVPYESVRWRPDSNPLDQNVGREKQVHVQTLTNMYRVRGHLIADLDPLSWKEPHTHAELDPATYGLTIWDLEREFFVDGVAGQSTMLLGDLLGILRDAYCRRIGVEYMHIQEPDQKRWIQEQVEGVHATLTTEEQLHILDRLNAAEAFERFLHTKYTGHKRFGLEGAESVIPLVDEVLDAAAAAGYQEAVLGMAHRGRLNVLANIVGKSFRQIFREFEGDLDPGTTQGTGDVKYHLGASGKFVGRSGISLPVTLASNPSHLEAVDPVVEGMVRARQDLIDDPGSFAALAVVIHGDAAFAGQGVVAETLNLSALRGYRVGGTVHVVVNNQLGFTTAPAEARSSVYPTDVAKMVQAPIFHVNGDDPEAVVRVARLAFGFRERFHKDVVIDLVCYRRHGHNEGDDPSYTQPLMYKRIEARRSVRKLYTETLVRRGDISMEEAERALDDFLARMQTAFEETRQSAPPSSVDDLAPPPVPAAAAPVETGVARDVLDRVADTLDAAPAGFTVHPKLARTLDARRQLYDQGLVDWSMAEALAFGSLLVEGTDVRLSGQDSRRGTFSQRHQVLVDYETGSEWLPLSGLSRGGGKLWLYDSLLSEYAALGFEYGYSVVHGDALVAWEAQFGDFANGAQIVIDQFLTAGHGKWGQPSGLVLLLPHGYEGQGPEHSSARIERFLTLCAGDNLQVVNATTAAQYFHVLRRQARRSARRPLVVFTPKSLLRARTSRSPVDELVTGRFREVVDDPGVPDRAAVRRVVLASGKVAYDAMAQRDELGLPAAVVRIEQLYPWPDLLVLDTVSRYPNAREVVWLQEEPENMGAWTFVHGRLHRLLREDYALRHVSRAESASPATGSQTVHQREQADLLTRAFDGL